jgi:hypothetical protein
MTLSAGDACESQIWRRSKHSQFLVRRNFRVNLFLIEIWRWCEWKLRDIKWNSFFERHILQLDNGLSGKKSRCKESKGLREQKLQTQNNYYKNRERMGEESHQHAKNPFIMNCNGEKCHVTSPSWPMMAKSPRTNNDKLVWGKKEKRKFTKPISAEMSETRY